MATYYDSTDLNDLDAMSREFYRYKNLYYGGMGVPITTLQYPEEYDASVEGANMEYHVIRLYNHTRMNSSYNYFTMGVKRVKLGIKVIEPTDGTRYAFVRMKCNPMNTHDLSTVKVDDKLKIETDCWVFLAYSSGTTTYNFQNVPVADTHVIHRTWELYFADSSIKSVTDDIETGGYSDAMNMRAFDSTAPNLYVRYSGLPQEYADLLRTLRTTMGYRNGSIVNATGGSVGGFAPLGWGLYNPSASITGLTKIPQFIPVWDARDLNDTAWINQVENWLHNGVREGDVDPFVPEYPEKYEIEDYKTNFRVFLSPYEDDPTRTKFSVIAYNNELINHFEAIEDYYGMTVTEKRSPIGQANVIQTTPRLSMYPTVGFHTKVGEFYQIGMWFHNEGDTEHSLPFHCLFEPSTSSKVGCYVKGATLNGQGCARTAIEDGHRFTGPDGSWVEVLYRAPSIEDLNAKYADEDDEDDNHTGTDSDYSGAGGLRTFSIDASGFEAINKKLWSTDWTTVFKSTTIDPVRCVIACKSIPFTASNVANANVVIANLDTGVQRNYVKTVKTFDCGGVVIGYKRGDFTDFTHTHVRCYLPYIGWVELPAEEVISRRAYPEVGLSAHTKHLYFKYIVDFVDGSCRCIVSVGGTGEGRTDRWYFDGNCGVDMPVTSDNHTQAVSNALRSGVSTGLGVVSAIAGAVTGNAGAVGGGVMTALQNAPNMFPTYSFTATSNGSGYINSSMNQHIMIVVERANVQEPNGYTSRLGKPCNMVLPLGSLRGFTKCNNVDVSGINATPDELAMIKSLLESGVYL